MATRWFVEAEKRNCERHVVPPDEESLRDAFNELAATEQWDEVSDQVHSVVRKLLAEVGVSDPADQGIAKPWRATLSRAIQEAMVESERRLINRMTGRNSLALNPVFYSFSDLAVSGMTALR